MRGLGTYWPRPVVMLILYIVSFNLSEARHHHQKLSSAAVVGEVYCDTCFQGDVSNKGSHYIAGATVGVECKEGSSRPAFYQEVKTDKQGKFKVLLPVSVSKHVKELQGCNVKLVKSSEPYCAVASTASSSAIHLKERKRGEHIFSAGFFTFKPLEQPRLCNRQQSITNSQLNSISDALPIFPTPNPDPNPTGPKLPLMPDLPTLPKLPPLPSLPSLPGLPGLPTQAAPKKLGEPSKDGLVQKEQVVQPQQIFPPLLPPIYPSPPSYLPPVPNPLQPPPLLPNPFQPPAPPLIPNPFQPPAPPAGILPPLPLVPMPPLPNLPVPLPGLTPPAVPATPPPFLPVPLPPLIPGGGLPVPLPPVIPGGGLPIPPASVTPKKASP